MEADKPPIPKLHLFPRIEAVGRFLAQALTLPKFDEIQPRGAVRLLDEPLDGEAWDGQEV